MEGWIGGRLDPRPPAGAPRWQGPVGRGRIERPTALISPIHCAWLHNDNEWRPASSLSVILAVTLTEGMFHGLAGWPGAFRL